MMGSLLPNILSSFSLVLALLLLLFPICSLGFPLCTDSSAPVTLKAPLAFCGYNGSSCCSADDDAGLQKQFKSMNISDSACRSIIESILCAKCNPFSAQLFSLQPKLSMVPTLCNSTAPRNSQSKDAASDFCAQVWDTCKDVSIWNSPFAPSLQGSTRPPIASSKLTDLWQSESDFCTAFGGSTGNESVCFDGSSVSFNTTPNSPPPKGLCLERIGNGSYLNMVAHPDGSNRIFFSNQAGKIWLATVPEQGSGGTLEFDESSPFLDITDEVHFDTAFGIMGLAFHPNFSSNGRFFVSYNCDKTESTSCSGRCSCNSFVGCDPSTLRPDSNGQPCQYHAVVSEYTANSSSTTPSSATSASSVEVRRIFTMGLPYTGHHGGQILFGPEDGYLYFMMGDGGNKGDPFNFAQNKKSLLGKIMRLDVNSLPNSAEVKDLSLWGNYSIPKDNPYADDSDLQPEIWALGLRNPWRCSFDSERPLYFFCADVGQEEYEEVDLISKGGNYGWRVYEGPNVYKPLWSPGGNTSLSSINAIFPVMGYSHNEVNTVGSASITGGYVYRSMVDPCMYGRYLYADLYGSGMWAGLESPESSGNYTSTLLSFSCAKDSPIPCDAIDGTSLPSLGFIFSFGEDNNQDVYILASKGVYRVVRPSRCNYACSKENSTSENAPPPSPSPSPSSSLHQMKSIQLELMAMFVVFFVVFSV